MIGNITLFSQYPPLERSGLINSVLLGLLITLFSYGTETASETRDLPVHSDRSINHQHAGHGHPHEAHEHNHGSSTHEATDKSVQDSLVKQLAVYAFFIAAASLLGGWLPSRVKLSHVGFQSLLSVVGGMLIGIGIFHLLPHAVYELGPAHVDFAMQWMIGGILAMFFLLRTLHVHHHEPAPVNFEAADNEHRPPEDVQSSLKHCDHRDHHEHSHAHQGKLTWAGMFLGLSIHTLLDGLALGASMQADIHHKANGWVGLGVLAGIVLHKPLDSLSFTTLMINSGQSRGRRLAVNLIYSLLCPIGALIFLLGVWATGEQTHLIVGASLAFSAGLFLCIALADLLPEMEFHSHHRWRLSFWLVFGVCLAWGIRYLEPAHLHQ